VAVILRVLDRSVGMCIILNWKAQSSEVIVEERCRRQAPEFATPDFPSAKTLSREDKKIEGNFFVRRRIERANQTILIIYIQEATFKS